MDPLTIVMLGVLALLIFFMFRNSRKRKQDLELLQEKMVPGAEVMTNFGLFGTLVSIDEEANVATIETSPGSTVRVHRQTLARVIEDDVALEEEASEEMVAEGAPVLNESSLDAPAEKPKRTKKTES
ncbi:preprotein translocase subunit YajC [Microcella humidisoli]|jgi:preprotein translocase subunit YajC|uniref:Preprotein translocase subunit YajC n=1 Tax=Microcella humidisoli TaxID=2963406 RepID=A0ABY5FVU8_9MICO|nr:preprotein translocase subunit YajC [Microcella humidisoli]UTT62383.1 preprotein translocase subunit YajC [Microcella humidisoli]